MTSKRPDSGAPSVEELRDRAADAMREYIHTPAGPARAIATKRAAEALADARGLYFYNSDGDHDLTGRSYQYRHFVSDALDRAGVPHEDRAALQSAIRYQISPILHERYGAELVERGLTGGSTRDRARGRRERELNIFRLFGGGGPLTDAEDAQTIAHQARNALDRLQTLTGAMPAEVEAVRAALTRTANAARDAAKRVVSD